jgi:hypothetical protein
MYKVVYSSQARKDAKNVSREGLKNKAQKLIDIVTTSISL